MFVPSIYIVARKTYPLDEPDLVYPTTPIGVYPLFDADTDWVLVTPLAATLIALVVTEPTIYCLGIVLLAIRHLTFNQPAYLYAMPQTSFRKSRKASCT